MKTTLQKLINKWEIETGSYIPNAPIYKAFIEEAKMFLNDEKEQIKNAFESGEKNIDFPALHGQGKLSDSNKYYDSNFGEKVEEAGI